LCGPHQTKLGQSVSCRRVISLLALLLAITPSVAAAYPISGCGETRGHIGRCELLGLYKVSVYHIGAQHDSDPFITATGLDIRTLEPGETICAISEENLRRSGGPVDFGDTLVLGHPGRHVANVCEVQDAMSNRIWDKGLGEWVPLVGYVDILVPPDIMEFWYDVPVFVCGQQEESHVRHQG